MNGQEVNALRDLVKQWQALADMHEKSINAEHTGMEGHSGLLAKHSIPNARIKALRQCAGELDIAILMLTQYER